MALLSLLKPLWELRAREALFTSTLWPSLPETHLLGLAAGLGYALWPRPETETFRLERSRGPALGAAPSPPGRARGPGKVPK
jgi:hypothetical protein